MVEHVGLSFGVRVPSDGSVCFRRVSTNKIYFIVENNLFCIRWGTRAVKASGACLQEFSSDGSPPWVCPSLGQDHGPAH